MTTDRRDPANEVMQADDARYRAMIANDLATLDRLLSEDLSYTHSSAVRDTKREYLESLRAETVKYLDVTRDAVTVKVYGDTAFMSGNAVIKAVIGGEQKVLNNRFLNVWVRNAGAWQMVAWASTPIPAQSK